MKRLILLLLPGLLAGGCNVLEYPLYILFAQHSAKVKAEYDGLCNKKIMVIVAGRPEIEWKYPYADLDLALAAAQAVGNHVEGVQLVDPEQVDRFVQQEPDWFSLPISEIAERFEAQAVVYLDLYQFNLAELDSVNLLRGRAGAQLYVYDMQAAKPDKPCYESEINVVYPEHVPLAMGDSSQQRVRRETIAQFTQQLAWKFYDHKVKIE